MLLLKYKQRGSKPNVFIESYGSKILVSQSGWVDYDQEEEVLESMANERIKALKSFSNRHYHSFIIKQLG